jgi:biopolymer transport protein ExbD/biopolymer transport protein TolR
VSIGPARRHGRQDLPVNAEINVTSLVDVAFTLLVIFIITAPILQGGVEVSVPRADVSAINQQDQPFIITVDRSGTVFIGETPMSADDFDSAFPQLARAAAPDIIHIRADSLALYGSALRVIATVANVAREEGFRFALVAEVPPPRQ